MTFRSLCLAILVATGAAAGSAIATSSSTPAAESTQNEGRMAEERAAAAARRNEALDACRQAVWPYIPPACIKNADGARASRPVRIVPVHGSDRAG